MSRTAAVTGVLVLSVVASGTAGPLLVTPLTPLSPQQQARILIDSLFTGTSPGSLDGSEGMAHAAGLFSNGGDVLAFDTGVLLTNARSDAAVPRAGSAESATTTTRAALVSAPASPVADLTGDPLALALTTLPVRATTPFAYIVGRRGDSVSGGAIDEAFADFLGAHWWPAGRQSALAEADTVDEAGRKREESAHGGTSQEPAAIAAPKAFTMAPSVATASVSASRPAVIPTAGESSAGLDSAASPAAFLAELVPGVETTVDGTSHDLDGVFVTASAWLPSDASSASERTQDERDIGPAVAQVDGDNGRLLEFLPNDAAPIVWIDPLAAAAHDFVARGESPDLATVTAPGSSLIDTLSNPIAAGADMWPAPPGAPPGDATSTDRFDTDSMLDSDDALAFIDGVASAGAARADASLAPATVVASVPEPPVVALLMAGIVFYGVFAMAFRGRRLRAAL